MNDLFEFAGGSVAGRNHRIAGKNNQDAYCCLSEPQCTVAVVCDGCGSGEHSEVGAHLGARLITHAIRRQARRMYREGASLVLHEPTSPAFWQAVREDILARLLPLAKDMGSSLSSVVNNYFLFTVVGVLLTPHVTSFFSLGDGVLLINGEAIPLGPFADNAPPYLAYGLVESSLMATNPEMLRFQINRLMPTCQVQSFLIGTDGVHDLIKASAHRLPGKTELVGALSQFWQQDRFFANPDMIRRRLAGINRDAISLDRDAGALRKEVGLLPDDTTLIVGWRRSVGGSDENEK